MFVLTAPIIDLVFTLMLVIIMVTGLLVGIAVTRRKRRERYFRRLDELRERYSPVVAAVLGGAVRYEDGRDALKAISGSDRIHVLERLLLASKPKPAQEPILRQLCEELGLVKVWQSQLGGKQNSGPLGEGGPASRTLVPSGSPLKRCDSLNQLTFCFHLDSWIGCNLITMAVCFHRHNRFVL